MAEQPGYKQPDDQGFPSEGQQARAAGKDKLSYNNAYDGDESNVGAGNPGVGVAGTSAGDTGARDGQSGAGMGTAGRGLTGDSSRNYPGPGTAADRGYGDTSDTEFGTGIGATDLASSSGLDERDLGDMSAVGTGD